MQNDMKTYLRLKESDASGQFRKPLAKALPSFAEAAEVTKKMTPAQIDVDWDARQKQRSASGTNLHVPTLV